MLRDANPNDSVSVEIELVGTSCLTMSRHLGSLAERHGMRMEVVTITAGIEPSVRAEVSVPRATNRTEAEETVWSLLEWIGPGENVP